MADVTLKKKLSSSWETLYVRTKTSLVEGLATELAAITIDAINDIGDVNISSPSEGQGLVFDASGNLVNDDINANTLKGNNPNDFAYAGVNDGVTGQWHYTNPNITALVDGLAVVLFTNGVAGDGSTDFEINDLGSYRVYYSNDYGLTTHYSSETVVVLSWDADQSRWYCHDFYDSTDDYRIRWQNDVAVGAYIHGYQLLMEGIDGKFYPVTEGGSTGNTNTVSTQEMRIGGKLLYYGSGTDAPAGTLTTGYEIYEGIYNGEMEYWNNRDSGWAVDMMPVYLVGTINANGNFVLDNTTYTSFLTQDLPTTEDGKVYVMIGFMNDTYDAWRLTVDHPWYEYKDGRLRLYVPEHNHDSRYLREYESETDINIDTVSAESYILGKDDSGWTQGTKPSGSHNGFGVLSVHTHIGDYATQFGFDSNQNKMWVRSANAGSYGPWKALIRDEDIIDDLLSTAANQPLSANQGRVLKGLIDTINTLLTSDESTLDSLQEVVDYIETNRETLDTLSISNITGLQTALDNKEPVITKNSAFNKNFGTTSGTVAAGDHSHVTTVIEARTSDPSSPANGQMWIRTDL